MGKKIKLLLKDILIRLASNDISIKAIERLVYEGEYLLGIGAGGGCESSGESGVIKKLREQNSESLCIFDVGANIGEYTELAESLLAGSNYEIHAFEPSKYTYNILQQRISSSNVKLNNFALGKDKGESYLYYDKLGSGIASLTQRKLDYLDIKFDKHEVVSITTIDEYCFQKNISKIHLLKLDVEGHELDVLNGAIMLFRKSLIEIVTFEFGGCNIDTRTFLRDFFSFFQDLGMTIFRITPTGGLYPLYTYKEKYENFRTTNYVAIQQSLL